jgi:hypothetical protein
MVSKVFPYIDQATGDLMVSIRVSNFEGPHLNLEFRARISVEMLEELGYKWSGNV